MINDDNNKRLKEIFEDFKNALERMNEGLKENIDDNSMAIDGTTQRFEFTFELAWKLARAILSYNGIAATNPRMVIKEAFSTGLFKDGAGWIEMLGDRNKTSHIYDEYMAREIYSKIKNNHYKLLEDFCQAAANFIKTNKV